jgi:hypothetical protein
MSSNHQPLRACAIQEDAFGEGPHLTTLWETDPHFQGQLCQIVGVSNVQDRALGYGQDDEDYLHLLVWQDFSTAAELAAANAALHQQHFFDELQRHLDDAREPPPIATVEQRLEHQRAWYRDQVQHFCREP